MHVTGTSLVAILAAASSASARAIVYRPEARAPAPTGALDQRAASASKSSSSVSVVTTLPITTTLATKSGIWSTASPAPFSYGTPTPDFWGVQGRGKNGPTNPDEPQLNTAVNQTSDSRLASINSIDDWCTFGPSPINNTDTLGDLEQTTVAYCTKPRNNARVIVRMPRCEFLRLPCPSQTDPSPVPPSPSPHASPTAPSPLSSSSRRRFTSSCTRLGTLPTLTWHRAIRVESLTLTAPLTWATLLAEMSRQTSRTVRLMSSTRSG